MYIEFWYTIRKSHVSGLMSRVYEKRKLLLHIPGYPLKFSPCLLLFGRRKNGYLWAAFLRRQTGRIQRLHYHSYPLREGITLSII